MCKTKLYWYQDALSDTYLEYVDEFEEIVALEISVSGANNEQAVFVIPADALSGDTIHIILEGVDEGGTNPRAYQRVIITVKSFLER